MGGEGQCDADRCGRVTCVSVWVPLNAPPGVLQELEEGETVVFRECSTVGVGVCITQTLLTLPKYSLSVSGFKLAQQTRHGSWIPVLHLRRLTPAEASPSTCGSGAATVKHLISLDIVGVLCP